MYLIQCNVITKMYYMQVDNINDVIAYITL